MDYDQCTGYLRDLGLMIKELAIEARKAKESDGPSPRDGFNLGRLMAFHEVVSLMQQQASAFGVSFEEIGLDDISPERDLL